MQKIKRFKLKDNTTVDDLVKAGFRDGGTWIHKEAKRFKSYPIEIKTDHYLDEFSVNIAFGDDLSVWNDYDWILVLDEMFGQPYNPFYQHYEDRVTDFRALEAVIERYNQIMCQIPFFVCIESITGDNYDGNNS